MQWISNFQPDEHIQSQNSLGMHILNHRRAATLLTKAARLHLEAAKQRMEGNLGEVAECMQGAQDLLLKVTVMQQDDMRRFELT